MEPSELGITGFKQSEKASNSGQGDVSQVERVFTILFCIFFWSLVLCLLNLLLVTSYSPLIKKAENVPSPGMSFQTILLLFGGVMALITLLCRYSLSTAHAMFSLEEILAEEEEEEPEKPAPQPKRPDIFYTRPPPSDRPDPPAGDTEVPAAPLIRKKPPPTWSLEEMSTLAKAMAKFPGGTSNRWEKITEMINTISNRSQKEVIVKCREVDLQSQRLGKDEAFRRFIETKSTRVEPKPAPSDNAGTKVQPEDDWTGEQQKAFEIALKTVSKGEDRWDQIAALVKGKTKQECVARFKEIRAKIISQRGGK